jgi:hypothetical protein
MLFAIPTTFSAREPVADQPIDFSSIIQITFEKNLKIAAARINIEDSDYQFRRFDRNLSQFIPLIVETTAERDSESFLDDNERISEDHDEAATSAGFKKAFFGENGFRPRAVCDGPPKATTPVPIGAFRRRTRRVLD